jgi:hypothetical protein
MIFLDQEGNIFDHVTLFKQTINCEYLEKSMFVYQKNCNYYSNVSYILLVIML